MEVKLFNNPLPSEVVANESLRRNGIPPDVWMCFEVAKTLYKGQPMLLLKQTVDQNFTPKQLRCFSDSLSLEFGMPVSFVFDTMPYYLRERLFEKNIYFIVSNKYVFWPSLFINTVSKDAKSHASLTSSAQYLLLFHLQKSSLDGYTAQDIAECTALQYTTITRAMKVLAEFSLCRIEKDTLRFNRICFNASGASLYEMAQPYLVNPVKAVYFCDALPENHNMLLAGVSALSRYTMLNDDETTTYAIDFPTFNSHKYEFRFLNPIEGKYRIEVWNYRPIRSEKETVDKLSLALSMDDTDDPRIEKERKSMMMDLW